ncbi:MAG: ABC transporter ATP-binding protein [Lagierella massiliensis]|nr:ABC transporter ATP-binding protein [Lagierella massiliensis]
MSIEVRNLSFSYGEGYKVLKNINFKLKKGEFMSVLGCNGAGKSTLFRCILGILSEYKGEILFEGKDIKKLSQRELASYVAYIPQIHRPTFGYSVENMVLMGLNRELSIFKMPQDKHLQRVHLALKQVGIEELSERNFAHLSGGEQQLTLIARAIAQDSKVFIMDEPTSALDFGNQYRVMNKIRELADKGYSVLMSTHNPQHCFTFADSVLALHRGKVESFGDPEKVINHDLIKKLYDINVKIEETESGMIINPYFDGIS